MNSVLFDMDGLMGVAAENPIGSALPCVVQSPGGNFR